MLNDPYVKKYKNDMNQFKIPDGCDIFDVVLN